jgi:hypothetical protein
MSEEVLFSEALFSVQICDLLVVIHLKLLSASAVNENRERLKYAKFRFMHLENVCGPIGMFFPAFALHVSAF